MCVCVMSCATGCESPSGENKRHYVWIFFSSNLFFLLVFVVCHCCSDVRSTGTTGLMKRMQCTFSIYMY